MKNQTIKDKVKQVIASKAGIEPKEVSEDMFFEDDLNLGELEVTEILETLEDEYKVDLLDDQENLMSVKDLIDLLEERLE